MLKGVFFTHRGPGSITPRLRSKILTANISDKSRTCSSTFAVGNFDRKTNLISENPMFNDFKYLRGLKAKNSLILV